MSCATAPCGTLAPLILHELGARSRRCSLFHASAQRVVLATLGGAAVPLPERRYFKQVARVACGRSGQGPAAKRATRGGPSGGFKWGLTMGGRPCTRARRRRSAGGKDGYWSRWDKAALDDAACSLLRRTPQCLQGCGRCGRPMGHTLRSRRCLKNRAPSTSPGLAPHPGRPGRCPPPSSYAAGVE